MPQVKAWMKVLARLGAEVRFRKLTEDMTKLESERAILLKLFPELGANIRSKKAAAPESDADSKSKKSASPAQRRRRASDSQRRLASEKMKQYWVKRRRGELIVDERQGVKIVKSAGESAAGEPVSP
jgi:hypothetical protein